MEHEEAEFYLKPGQKVVAYGDPRLLAQGIQEGEQGTVKEGRGLSFYAVSFQHGERTVVAFCYAGWIHPIQ